MLLMENKSSSSTGFSGTELLFGFIESLLMPVQSNISAWRRGISGPGTDISARRPSIGARPPVISAQRILISE